MLYPNIENPKNTTLFLVLSKKEVPKDHQQLLVCLTCPNEPCYKQTISEFAVRGFPLKFTSLKGEFSERMPCFLQFENTGHSGDLEPLLADQHRQLIGSFDTKDSFSACIAGFFEGCISVGV